MSVMDQSLNELQAVVNGQLPATVGGVPLQVPDHVADAQAQVDQLGSEPTLSQVAALMVSKMNRVEVEAKQCRTVITQHLMETIKVVSKHSDEIRDLKTGLQKASQAFGTLNSAQENMSSKMSWMEEKVGRTYDLACESKQRSSKGNFILSGEHLPRYNPNENLYQIVAYSLHEKYGISLSYHELKALHRLPGNRIIFALHSRLPGMAYEQIINVMNTNPYRNFKVYVSIQLFEPFSELFFFARRLKHHKVIAYYRLDENGNTLIALNENSRNFKFTGVDQLVKLGVQVPGHVMDEVNERRTKILQSEQEAATKNTEKATMLKPERNPNTVPLFEQHQRPQVAHNSNPNNQATTNHSLAGHQAGKTTPTTTHSSGLNTSNRVRSNPIVSPPNTSAKVPAPNHSSAVSPPFVGNCPRMRTSPPPAPNKSNYRTPAGASFQYPPPNRFHTSTPGHVQKLQARFGGTVDSQHSTGPTSLQAFFPRTDAAAPSYWHG